MAGVDLFRPISEDVVRAAMREAKQQARNRMSNEYSLAIDYLENRAVEDVRSQLHLRYGRTQAGDAGQTIEPVSIPLVERYVSEAANAYNRPVKRTLVDENGEESDATKAATKQLDDALAECGYDERMHRREQIEILIGTCGINYEAKRGKLRPVIVLPQNIYPVAPKDTLGMDPSDPEDYLGYIVENASASEDTRQISKRSFAFLTHAETAFYEALDPYEPQRVISVHSNPFIWPQTADTEDARGVVGEYPLQMLTFWHKRLPIGELLVDTDVDIVYLNREVNVQLSVLLDTMRVQGWSQMFMNLLNPESPPAQVSYGSRFALPLQQQESIGFASAPNPYTQLIDVLKAVVKLEAIAKRQSPTDFAIDSGGAPQSGFAKLIDSLPKIEARHERIRRLTYMEEQVAWPRIGSILRYLGKIDGDPTKLRMKVEFADVEFPRTVDEEARKQEHEFKHGMSSPAEVLAKKLGITKEEADERIAENKGGAQPPAEEQQQAQPQRRPGLLGALIGTPQGVDNA